jgi:hypothetical protein
MFEDRFSVIWHHVVQSMVSNFDRNLLPLWGRRLIHNICTPTLEYVVLPHLIRPLCCSDDVLEKLSDSISRFKYGSHAHICSTGRGVVRNS